MSKPYDQALRRRIVRDLDTLTYCKLVAGVTPDEALCLLHLTRANGDDMPQELREASRAWLHAVGRKAPPPDLEHPPLLADPGETVF